MAKLNFDTLEKQFLFAGTGFITLCCRLSHDCFMLWDIVICYWEFGWVFNIFDQYEDDSLHIFQMEFRFFYLMS